MILHHKTMYEGTLERVPWRHTLDCILICSVCSNQFPNHILVTLNFELNYKVAAEMMTTFQAEMHLAVYSETESPGILTYASSQVKDKLVEDRGAERVPVALNSFS